MKITVTGHERSFGRRGYPYVGEWMGSKTDQKKEGQVLLVLFASKDSGICVKSVNAHSKVGESHGCWVEESFAPFDGTVKIEI